MKYRPTECVKCGGELQSPGPKGGRPSRFCSDGCKVSAEAEMRRLNVHLRAFEEGRYVELLNRDEVSERRQKVLAEMRARFDHLAGVPKRVDDD
jgi:hypothetical protein